MKACLAVLMSLMVYGCAYSSSVIELGPNEYYVSGTAGSEMGGKVGAKKKALEAAAKHCNSLGYRLEILETTSTTVNELGTGSADVRFKCE